MDKRNPGKGPEQRKRKEAPGSAANTKKNDQSSGGRAPGRPQKRVKIQDARFIRTQPAEAALEDGKLDLQKFLNAREFEIKALESSMQKCKAANSTRSFQQVPRAMRRRTASHNVKRVPKRLRERAKREQIEDNTPTVDAKKRRPRTTRARIRAENAKRLHILANKKRKRQQEKALGDSETAAGAEGSKKGPELTIQTRQARPKIRRNALNAPPKQKSKFRKRQINKTWLPTHLWHAKRATMTEPSKPLWKFAIPLTSTEKCYRPTHRASGQKGAVAWDMSYMSTIGLYGTAEGVERVLRALGLTQEGLWGNRGQKWRSGTRTWSGILSKQRKGSPQDIGPATIIWNPEAPREDVVMEGSDTPAKPQKQLLIRTHPACFLELFDELVKLVKMQTPQPHVEDLRYEIGSIELTGPGSTESLIGILQPYYDKQDTECHARVFKSLFGVVNPSSLPKNALLAFSIKDPRLDYPPKRVNCSSGSKETSLVETLTKWPVEEGLKPSGLFNRDVRFKASLLPTQKSINRRKGSGIPGQSVQVTSADPPIPIILFTSKLATASHAQGTWTLLAPWKCILPLWYSLMHYPLTTGGNPRLGGLDEVRQVAFEQGAPWFPGDFPGTEAGYNWEVAERIKRKREWDKRPKSKKVAWESLDLGAGRKGELGDGLACDFEFLFGIPKSTPESVGEAQGSTSGSSSGPRHATSPLPGEIRQISKSRFNSLLASPDLERPPAHSIIKIRLSLVTRGVANTCARIYRLPSRNLGTSSQTEVPSTLPHDSNSLPPDLRDQWLRQLPLKPSANKKNRLPATQARSQKQKPQRIPADANMETRKALVAKTLLTTKAEYPPPPANQLSMSGYPLCPNEEDLIGFVTSGSFCLSEGKGMAIGSISAAKALETLRTAGEGKEGSLCIVRNAGESVGWLARWEAV
ncbi:Ribonucleases P/MRP protein subunit POP1 domain containing protein [Naviculisporaceae sp. PSN 640]